MPLSRCGAQSPRPSGPPNPRSEPSNKETPITASGQEQERTQKEGLLQLRETHTSADWPHETQASRQGEGTLATPKDSVQQALWVGSPGGCRARGFWPWYGAGRAWPGRDAQWGTCKHDPWALPSGAQEGKDRLRVYGVTRMLPCESPWRPWRTHALLGFLRGLPRSIRSSRAAQGPCSNTGLAAQVPHASNRLGEGASVKCHHQ